MHNLQCTCDGEWLLELLIVAIIESVYGLRELQLDVGNCLKSPHSFKEKLYEAESPEHQFPSSFPSRRKLIKSLCIFASLNITNASKSVTNGWISLKNVD